MADGSKRLKGQLQIVEGSPTGEPIVISKIDYDSCFNPKYVGEAKVGSQDNQHVFFIQKIEYTSAGEIAAIKTAMNQTLTGATSFTLDTSYGTGLTLLTIPDGDFEQACIGDEIFINSGTNFAKVRVETIVDSTSIVIQTEDLVDETNTPITSAQELLLILKNESTKDFARRRWDKRNLYLYA